MNSKIFKSEEGRAQLEAWYARFLEKIAAPIQFKKVKTRFGAQHVLLAGDLSKPPLIALHSMLTSSAHLVSELQPLLKKYHIVAPDIPGQSIRGIPTRLSYSSNEHALWLHDIFESMNIESADVLGVSLGGFVARQFAEIYRPKVNHLILIVPAGIVQGSLLKGFSKMAIPMLLYKASPTRKNLKKLTSPLLTTWDEDWAAYLGDAMLAFKPHMKIPPLATKEQLRELTMPCLIVSSEQDISFPGVPLNERAESNIPKVETELIEGGRHSPPTTNEFRIWLSQRIMSFAGVAQ